MTQIVAVLPHSRADKLGPAWKLGRSNAYTRTMVRVCGSEEEAWQIGRTCPLLGRPSCIWTLEVAGT